MAERRAAIFGTEKDQQNCPFYLKIGACRHGDRCSRLHNKPVISQTILLPNLYQSPISKKAIEQNGGVAPNLTEVELQQHFDEFYEDIFEGLTKYGQVDLLNVCANLGDHLVGNVYVKYAREDEANESIKGLKGRFYDGRPIIAEFSPVTDFTEARCRQYDIGACNRGGYCNFMHLHTPSKSLQIKLFGDRRSRSPSPRGRYERGGGGRDQERYNDRDRDYGRGRGYDRYNDRDRGYDRYNDRYDRDRGYGGRRDSYDRDRRYNDRDRDYGGRHSKSPDYSRAPPDRNGDFNRSHYPPPPENGQPPHPIDYYPPPISSGMSPLPTQQQPISSGMSGYPHSEQPPQPPQQPPPQQTTNGNNSNNNNNSNTVPGEKRKERENEDQNSDKRLKVEPNDSGDHTSIQWSSSDERRTDDYDVKTSLKTSIAETKE
ncbi:hypothetical protein DICPUDRAFT_57704 [Dictyostelium purpureum]|uniref:Uncharacterized protein n=1 Tax=Dictyostelium purpureum TaxID=5786 RepID=F0ZX75_DICPU|nr:uncharacterized protein DICPUDRAFT_57704 [Dictyostelium purpureum]EGC31448.1 hypothetical protein DICPUDRAFT_57704 [Dictyostelium purpureum]|eukprot:XP_003292017.1 hypothetical protein DICPUDRAFT_57704 [Dictyostelium purpureum]